MKRKTPVSDSMNVLNARLARASGTSVGTETTCAPMTSFNCQPKPFASPYRSRMVAGAACTVLWQTRQAGLLIWMGRAR